MDVIASVIFQGSVGLLIFCSTLFFGEKSRLTHGYANLADVGRSEGVGFNVVFRIFMPAIVTTLVAVILYKFNGEFFLTNLYLCVFAYSFISLSVLLATRRLLLVNPLFLLFTHIVANYLAYIADREVWQKGLEAILPSFENFKTEFWLLAVVFLYTVLNSVTFEESGEKRRAEVFKARFLFFRKKYWKYLKPEFRRNASLVKIFFTLMVVEDFNRGFVFRRFENLLQRFGLAKTTGIMQVRSPRRLSDEESILKAQKIIESVNPVNLHGGDDFDLLMRVCEKYNPGWAYYTSALQVFGTVSEAENQLQLEEDKDYYAKLKNAREKTWTIINKGAIRKMVVTVPSEKEAKLFLSEGALGFSDCEIVLVNRQKEEEATVRVRYEFGREGSEHDLLGGANADIIISMVIGWVGSRVLDDVNDTAWSWIKNKICRVLSGAKDTLVVGVTDEKSEEASWEFSFEGGLTSEAVEVAIRGMETIVNENKEGGEYRFIPEEGVWR